jgi:sugar/nucleoside kinase (ribokinase family)
VKDDLIFQPWAEMAEGLKYITYLKADKAEAEYLTGLTDLHEAALMLQSFGPREIVLTQTSGVTAVYDGEFYSSPFTPRSLAGRTGRGDTCFSTYIAKRLSEDPQTACRWAGLVTTYKQETPGPWKGCAAEIQTELARIYGSTT